MKKITYQEFAEKMRKFNDEKNIEGLHKNKRLEGVVVITKDSFKRNYTEKERSYKTNNEQKAFLPDMCSNSIFADCLDGKDLGVRLDWYIPKNWKIDYCYFL